MRAEQALPEPGPRTDGDQVCAQGRAVYPQVDAALPAAAAPGRLRPGGPVRRGRAHPAPGVLLGGDAGEPASWGLCSCSRGPAGARTHRAPASLVAQGPVRHSRQGCSHQPRPGSCASQNWGREKPPGQQPGPEQRCSLGVGRSLSLSPPSLLTGPWPASWHCCSWSEATRFTRSRGMKPVCTGGSLVAGFAPPVAPRPSPGRVR